MSDGEWVAAALAVNGLPAAIMILKRRYKLLWLALAFAVLPFAGTGALLSLAISVVACVRLARPHSWWYERLYGQEKRLASAGRHPDARPLTHPVMWQLVIAILAVLLIGAASLLAASS